jgi:lysophospholipid acyltransferase (LPLAT)-like uncharacterized protein
LGAAYVLLLRLTCRVRFVNDPRPALRLSGRAYAYAFLHAHQIASVVAAERGTAALVSRSRDGALLIPALRVRGVLVVRGSTRRGEHDKGGREALGELCAHVRAGGPAYFAVDGPRGPRGHVHRGVVELAQQTGAHILPAVAVSSRALRLSTWDGLEIPWPWSQITVVFAPPITAATDVTATRMALGASLAQLEAAHTTTLER